jgi:hypothetical protein
MSKETVRLLKPIQVYVCPRDGSHVDTEFCKNCHCFVKADLHRGEWTIYCKQPADRVCAICDKPLKVVERGQDYIILGCPEHREFDQIVQV